MRKSGRRISTLVLGVVLTLSMFGFGCGVLKTVADKTYLNGLNALNSSNLTGYLFNEDDINADRNTESVENGNILRPVVKDTLSEEELREGEENLIIERKDK